MFTLDTLYFAITTITLAAIFIAPTVIAFIRGHKNSIPIALINIFLGLTFFGYIVALVWSFSDNCDLGKRALSKVKDWQLLIILTGAFILFAVFSGLFFWYKISNLTNRVHVIEIKEYRLLQ